MGDTERLGYYKGQTSVPLLGNRLYVHVLPVAMSACAIWSLLGITESPTSGGNCNL